MKVVVFGLGRFGSQVAKTLAERHVEVIGVDKEKKITDELKDVLSLTQNLDCGTEEGLEAVELENTDVAVLAMGEGENVSAKIAAFLHEKRKEEKYKDMKVIARAGERAQARVLELAEVTRIVRVEEDAGAYVANLIQEPLFKDEDKDKIYIGPNGDSCKIKAEKKKFIGKTLRELNFGERFKVYVYRIVGKDGQEKALVPPADYKVEEGDILEILGKNEDIEKFKEKYAGEITT